MNAPNRHLLAIRTSLCLLVIAGPTAHASEAGPAAQATLRLSQDLTQPAEDEILGKTVPRPAKFRLTVHHSCPDGHPAASLFLSVLDEFVSADLDSSPKELLLKVPAARLAAIRETAHCPMPGDQLLAGQAQAFATLTCTGEVGSTRQTIAQPLSLWFRCPPSEPQEAPTPTPP